VECVQELQRQGIQTVVELGPGRVLSGLIQRISKDLKVFNVEDSRSLNQTLAAVTAR
jgi:[acyl-carrier-protein] S-malonyltransferase